MSSSDGGKRKRGRPVILTPEQRLERARERWRRKKARKRKAAQDAAWQDTNSGYFVQLWVPHYPRLVKELVRLGYLDKADKDIAPRVDAAADKVLKNYGSWPSYGFRESGVVKAGAVRVRMTQELASKLADDEYARRFPPNSLRWADEQVEYCRRWDLEDKARTAREQRKPLFLRVPPRGKIIDVSDILRDAEAERDQLRREFRTPEEFKEEFLQNRGELTRAAERYLSNFCDSYVPDPPSSPCNCKLKLPECECPSRFRPSSAPGALPMRPGPQRPWGARPLVKQDLYSGPKPRWWTAARYDDDPIIRSHDKSAGVGMKGFDAGGRSVWKNDKAIYYSEQDNRASTRDYNKTAKEGEKALQKPYDDPTGTPKSWSNPSDVEPDSEDTIIRLGKRVIEEGAIEPYVRKKGYTEDDE